MHKEDASRWFFGNSSAHAKFIKSNSLLLYFYLIAERSKVVLKNIYAFQTFLKRKIFSILLNLVFHR